MTDPTMGARRGYSRYVGDYSAIPNDLVRLEELDDFQVVEGEPDPRGWHLIGSDGETLGTIDDLLVSPATLTAYFALVKCGGWFQNKRFVVPLATITFNEAEEKAYGPYLREHFRQAPEYSEGALLDYAGYYRYWSAIRPS